MSQPVTAHQPLENSLLHTLLVQTNRLQTLPLPVVLLALALNVALATGVWWAATADPNTTILIALSFSAANAVDWALLWGLRATRRSFGPDKPSILALSAVRALILIALGLLNLPIWIALVLLVMISTLVFYATWIEPFRLGVTTQRYTTPKLDSATPPLRILQIGDIHIERLSPRERSLNQRIEQLQPDLIVFTGDFVNISYTHDPEAEKDIREVISTWHAPLGVYCVPGTPIVEPIERVRAFVAGLDNLKLLENQWITVNTAGGPLHILGLMVTHDMQHDRSLLRKMMLTAPSRGLRLLLMHPPDIAPEANDAGVDLYFCGHTHGGQIRLPLIGAIFSSSHLGNRFIMGRYELGNTTLYTSRGVGMEGFGAPRARFLCPPEIVLWEIQGTG